MILHIHPSGPLIEYKKGVLFVEDLNPFTKMQWRMSRLEMFALAFRSLIAALRP